MDLDEVVDDYVRELLGQQADEFGLASARDSRDDAGAAAVSRLRRRIAEILVADGWQPPADTVLVDEVDGRVTSVLEERAALRAQASRARSDAGRTTQTSSELHDPTVAEMLDAMRSEVLQMRQALRTRASIEQAKGIVMARYGLGADAAWNYLVRTSQQRNVKLRDLADELVSSVARAEQSDLSS